MTNAYIDPFIYRAAPTGQETASMIGNLLRIASGGALQGSASLPVATATTMQLNAGDSLYLFDGSLTEIVSVSNATAPGATSIPVSTLQYAHAAGVAVCSDGAAGGSLSQTILNASAEIEVICRQPLLQATYTETYALQTLQASLDSIGTLNVRTTKNPVTAVASALLTTDVASGQAISVANIKYKGQLVSIVGAGASMPRSTDGFIDLTFTAGFVYASLPQKIKQACIWLTSELLSDRMNPTGAAIDQQGKIHTQYRLKDEKKSSLYMRAEEALREFVVKVY